MSDRKYTLFWRDGKRQIVRGRDPADAMNRAGYGHGALAALDFYASGDEKAYTFIDGKWTLFGAETAALQASAK